VLVRETDDPAIYLVVSGALRIDDRDLFDLLAADVELLQGMFRALLGLESRGRAVESATRSATALPV
jgi:hypothetical protein